MHATWKWPWEGEEWDANANTLSQCAMCKRWMSVTTAKQRLTTKTATLQARSHVVFRLDSLDLGNHVSIGVGRLNVQQDGFIRQLFTTHTQHQVQSSFILDVVVRHWSVIVHSVCIPNLWGFVFTPPVGYSRPTSGVNDLSVTKIEFFKAIRLSFSPKFCRQRVAPFYRKPLHASSFIDFLWIIMNSNKILSIATRWKKNSMPVSIPCTFSRAWAWGFVLQLLGVNGLM